VKINFKDDVERYQKLIEHIDHRIVCRGQKSSYHLNPTYVSLFCETCGVVLADAQPPKPPEIEPEEKGEREVFGRNS